MEREHFFDTYDYQGLHFQRLGLASIGLICLLLLFFVTTNQITFIGLSTLAFIAMSVIVGSYFVTPIQNYLSHFFCGGALVLLVFAIHETIQQNFLTELSYLNLIIAFALSFFIRYRPQYLLYIASFIFINLMALVLAETLFIQVPLYGLMVGITALAMHYTWSLRNHLTHRNKNLQSNVFNYAKLYEQVFLNTPVGIAVINQDYEMVDINMTLCKMLGYSARDLRQMNACQIIPQDNVSVDQEIYKSLFNQQLTHYNTTKYWLTKDKDLLETESIFSLVKDQEGESLYVVLILKSLPEKVKIPVPVEKVVDRKQTMVHENNYYHLVQKTNELDKILQYLNRQSNIQENLTQQKMLESAMEGLSELQMYLKQS